MDLEAITSTRSSWLKWRKNGIGGSDAGPVMSLSPHRDALHVYEDKIDPNILDESISFQASMGMRAEDMIREHFNLSTDMNYTPKLFEHVEKIDESKSLRLKASMDGYDSDNNCGLEIKLMKQKDWAKIPIVNASAVHPSEFIPPSYYAQAQHLMYVASKHRPIEKINFVAYLYRPFYESLIKNKKAHVETKFMKHVEIKADIEFQEDMLKKEANFWFEHVVPKIPPSTEHGYKMLVRKPDAIDIECNEDSIINYFTLKDELEKAKERLDIYKKTMHEFAETTGHESIIFNNRLKMSRVTKKGSVQYKKIESLNGVDLDSYRSKNTVYWDIREVKS